VLHICQCVALQQCLEHWNTAGRQDGDSCCATERRLLAHVCDVFNGLLVKTGWRVVNLLMKNEALSSERVGRHSGTADSRLSTSLGLGEKLKFSYVINVRGEMSQRDSGLEISFGGL
jgi:hypothetical protein